MERERNVFPWLDVSGGGFSPPLQGWRGDRFNTVVLTLQFSRLNPDKPLSGFNLLLDKVECDSIQFLGP